LSISKTVYFFDIDQMTSIANRNGVSKNSSISHRFLQDKSLEGLLMRVKHWISILKADCYHDSKVNFLIDSADVSLACSFHTSELLFKDAERELILNTLDATILKNNENKA
jgi:hypothetical protein